MLSRIFILSCRELIVVFVGRLVELEAGHQYTLVSGDSLIMGDVQVRFCVSSSLVLNVNECFRGFSVSLLPKMPRYAKMVRLEWRKEIQSCTPPLLGSPFPMIMR